MQNSSSTFGIRAKLFTYLRINLPNGIEYDLAEIGSGTTKTMASITLDLKDTYFHFTVLRQSGKGVVHSR
jgi:hypothetical protein